MTSQLVERTNEQISKVRKYINADEFSVCYSDTNEERIKSLFGMLLFGDLHHDTKQPTRDLV